MGCLFSSAKWDPPDCDGKTGAIPKRGSIISISGHRIQPSRQPRKNGLNEGEGGRTNTESDKSKRRGLIQNINLPPIIRLS